MLAAVLHDAREVGGQVGDEDRDLDYVGERCAAGAQGALEVGKRLGGLGVETAFDDLC